MQASTHIHTHTHLAVLLVHHVQLLLTQPGLHLGRVEEVLLRLVHGVQDQLPPLSLDPQEAPQLCQLVVSRPHVVGLGTPYGRDDGGPFQDVLDPALVALKFPLESLQAKQRATMAVFWKGSIEMIGIAGENVFSPIDRPGVF